MKGIVNIFSVISILVLLTSAIKKREEIGGIKFFEGTWQEALKKSTDENKPVFLSLTTSWCGWCKKLKQNVFTDKKVGEYFNKKFINIELDGEHGEGQRLARKYGVSEYPSLFLVDKNENQLLSSEGYHDPDDLIKLFKSAVR